MAVATVFLFLCFGATIVSATIYGEEISIFGDSWNDYYFLKFNSPSGKTFYIETNDGTIHREKEPETLPPPPPPPGSRVDVPVTETKKSPFISFVAIDFKVYDIYFENDDLSYIPRVEESKSIYKNKYLLIRHRLVSFVGPNKKVFKVIYNDEDEPNITVTEKSSEALDHFQIKTFGPYEKWEHTYDFSENGEFALDHTLSPIPVLPDRSIPLPKLEPSTFLEPNFINLFVTFDTPSGTKYHITNQLNIIPIRNDNGEESDAAYITFTEPNGRTYDILIDEKDMHPFVVEKKVDENYFATERLYSFVGPNQMLYRIDHKNESDHEVPILVSNSSESSDLQITFLRPGQYFDAYVKYVFLDNGMKLFDRVDEYDWTPLNEQPAIPVEEVTAGSEMTNLPFLTLYTSSGNNYHIFTNRTNASIAVEKGSKNAQPLYISYYQTNGRKTNIYFVPGDHPYLEEETNPVEKEGAFSFFFTSLVTPDQKTYTIESTWVKDNEFKPSILLPEQVKDPIDLYPEGCLTITIQNENGWENIYRFTWNGDKLIEAFLSPPKSYIDSRVLISAIGK